MIVSAMHAFFDDPSLTCHTSDTDKCLMKCVSEARDTLKSADSDADPAHLDVFVTYCGEGFDVITDTLRAALA